MLEVGDRKRTSLHSVEERCSDQLLSQAWQCMTRYMSVFPFREEEFLLFGSVRLNFAWEKSPKGIFLSRICSDTWSLFLENFQKLIFLIHVVC